MKVLQVITQSSWGGAQRHVYDIATALHSSCTVVVVHGKNEFADNALFEKKVSDTGVRTVRVAPLIRAIRPLYDLRALYQLIQVFRTEHPDIVHTHSSKAGIVGNLAARVARVPRIIHTIHGLPQLEERSWIVRQLFMYVTWGTCLCAHKVVVLSTFEKKIVARWWGIQGKVVHIYNGIDVPRFFSKVEARKKIGAMIHRDISKEFVIGGIAEFTENKGLREWLVSFAAHNNTALYVHFGTGALQHTLHAQVKALGISERVHFLGFVPNASTFLKAFDLFVLPSKKEGLPYVLLEAKMAGVPIEAAPIGGVPEVLDTPIECFSKERMMAQIRTLYDS